MLAGLAVGSFILRPKTEPKDPQDVFVLSYVFGSGTIQHLIICVNGIPLEFHYKPEPSRTFPSVLALLASSPFVDQRALAPTCIETWTGPVMSRTTSSAGSRRSMSSGSTSAMQIRCAPRCHICTGTVFTPATSAPALAHCFRGGIRWTLPSDCTFHFFLSHQQKDAGNTMSAL